MDTVLDWFAVCAVLLFLKMFALSLMQGYHRIGKRQFPNPEDAAVVGRRPVTEDLPEVQRAQRAWRNDLENIPVFFALGLIYVLVDASPQAAPSLFVTFTASRYVHSVTYLLALQPWRTLAYGIGIGCLFGMSFSILRAVLV